MQGLSATRADGISFEFVRTWLLWLMFATSFVVKIEPAPCDIVFFAVFGAFLISGLRIPTSIALISAFLIIYNIAGVLSYIPVMAQPRLGMFVITSIYMAISALFICSLLSENTQIRFATISNGWIVGACIASVIAIAGFFTGSSYLTLAGRATGLFKDPNVLSTYLNLPIVLLVQRFLLNTSHSKFLSASMLLLIMSALFLAFSRGAWGSGALSILLLVGITFVLSGSQEIRFRIILVMLGGALLLAVLIGGMLSIPEIRDLFFERATLNQSYDVGETGRFGAQLNSIPLLLERPLGFGPLQYASYMGQDPHNTFLNAFASYGWLGGIIYIVMILTTLSVGVRTIVIRAPWQTASIAVFSSLVALIFQGIQIDTDHWRHFYWLLGLMWGLFAASVAHSNAQSADDSNWRQP